MTGETRLRAPQGKYRVIGVDLFSHEDYLIDDYDSEEQARSVTDEHNMLRTGSMDTVYYAYNDLGYRIRSHTAVGGSISP